MPRNIEYNYPANIINVPLERGGPAAAAHQALSRFRKPVKRADAEFEERVFEASAEVARGGQCDELFLVVPDPPQLGALGAIVVRYHAGGLPGDIDDLVAESAGGDRFVLEPPDVSTHATPLGTGTRNLLRWTAGEPAPDGGRFLKQELPITEQLSWYWYIEDDNGDSTVLNVTLLNQNLGESAFLIAVTDAFATGITFA